MQAHDYYDSGEVQVASPPITSDNAATPHVLIDDKSIIDLSSTISDVEEQVEFDDPYINIETPAANFEYASSSKEEDTLKGPTNDHHQTTTLVYVPVDLQLGNATLQCTILVNVQLMYFLHHKGTIRSSGTRRRNDTCYLLLATTHKL